MARRTICGGPWIKGKVLETFVTKRRDRKAALKLLRKPMKRYGQPEVLVTDKLRSYGAAMKVVGNIWKQETGRWLNNRRRIPTCRFDDGNVRCSVSDRCDVCRNSPLSTPRFTTTSARNATSTLATNSSSTVPPPWPSGAV
jgi:putative transposase